MMTPVIAISRYCFTLSAQAAFRLSGHPGAMLRGAWGDVLRGLACSTGQPTCTECPVRAQCRYAALFEPQPDQQRSVPPPYNFQAPLAAPKQLSSGDTWHFNMVLFGDACSEISLITQAWQQAALRGLGQQQAPMRLEQLALNTHPGDEQLLWKAGPLASSQPPRIADHDARLQFGAAQLPARLSGVEIRLQSPLRLQAGGRILSPQQLTAEALLSNLWRRIQLYNRYYLKLPTVEKPTVQGVELHIHDLHRQAWQRHSRRQGRQMRLDGLVGSLTLHGNLADWWPWLWLGQYTHLGKNTAFGLGHYQLKALC